MSGADEPQSHRRVVSYIDKSRRFYAAQGYEQPYRWASHGTVPFTPAPTDLSTATVGVVTTSYPVGFERPKSVYAMPSDPVPAAMYTDDLSWDKDATHTDDVGSFLPLVPLTALVEEGRIGAVSARFYGVPTRYSQGHTSAEAEELVDMAQADRVDVMVLVPI